MSVYANPPLSSTSDALGALTPEEIEHEHQRVLQETKAFVADRDTLLELINHSDELLGQLNNFGSQFWLLAYPLHQQPVAAPGSLPALNHLRRSPSQFDHSAQSPRPFPSRAATIDPRKPARHLAPSPLSILCIDNASLPGRRASGPGKDIESSLLMRQSLASMLSERIESVQSHLADLRTRVMDCNSRILVTGDLNAGKSTFVNALLGREVAPTDQQPCTEVMSEILDNSLNSVTREEIHAIRHGVTYDVHDPSTFDTFPLDQLSELVNNAHQDDEEPSPYQLLKVYIAGANQPQVESNERLQRSDAISLLRNGHISVSFIDSPGLNRDTLSTMELFAKQSTIDVVVFVVSAENQFTLSAQEFLWAASQEKAYVFVVVNKWGGIKDKVRAERRIREQLRKLSPATWAERAELVHFVDSQEAIQHAQQASGPDGAVGQAELPPFDHLQRALSSFVFLRRSVSKLQPAQTYTRNLLQDLAAITAANVEAAKQLYEDAQARLENILPRFTQLSDNSTLVEEHVGQVEEETVAAVQQSGRKILSAALRSVREGKLADLAPREPGAPAPYFPTYDGLLTIFQYAEDVRKVLLGSLEDSVRFAEDSARQSTTKAVDAIRENPVTKSLLEEHHGPVRTFNPSAMFARTRKLQLVNASQGISGPLTSTLGLASFGDLVDFERLNWFGGLSKIDETHLTSTSLVGSIGFGTLTLFGTGVTGGRAVVEGLVKVTEVLGRQGARKWTGALVGVMSVGFGLYLIADIPRAVPRNIGRKLSKELDLLAAGCGRATWVEAETERLGAESRKVVRLAGWDLRERFRSAVEEASAETKGAQDEVEKAVQVEAWLDQFSVEITKGIEKVENVGKGTWYNIPSN